MHSKLAADGHDRRAPLVLASRSEAGAAHRRDAFQLSGGGSLGAGLSRPPLSLDVGSHSRRTERYCLCRKSTSGFAVGLPKQRTAAAPTQLAYGTQQEGVEKNTTNACRAAAEIHRSGPCSGRDDGDRFPRNALKEKMLRAEEVLKLQNWLVSRDLRSPDNCIYARMDAGASAHFNLRHRCIDQS